MERDLTERIESILIGIAPVKQAGSWLRNVSTKLFLESGFRPVKDFLNGTWLEHPLHPLLTDVPVGAWTAAMLFDLLDVATGETRNGQAAGIATGLGALAGAASVVTGLMDFTDLDQPEETVGFVHGVTNITATLIFTTSFLLRWRAKWQTRDSHFLLSSLGYAVLSAGAYVGGSLVFRQGVMVNRNAYRKGPKEFTPVMAAAELAENKPVRVEASDQPILLVRQGANIYAIGAVCSHYGGPLEKGKLGDCTVECPWHYSVYSLEDGSVRSGPTTAPVPAYETRISNGQIEVRMRK